MSFRSFMSKHGTAIATGGSIVLTIAAVVIAIKKSKDGAEAEETYKENIEEANGNAQLISEAKVEYVKDLGKAYKWSIACAAGAVLLAYVSNRSDAKKIANLGATLALSEDKISKLYNYIEKKLEPKGVSKREIEEDIVESDPDNVYDNNPVKAKKRYRKEETVLFKDSWDGTLFESTMKDYYVAVDRTEAILLRSKGYGLGYNKWRNLLGLEDIPAGAYVGWKPGDFRSYLQQATLDGQTVYIICYKKFPNSDYCK